MKKLLFFITIFTLSSVLLKSALAATPTPSKSVSPVVSETLNQKLDSQINQLKDKIASRVSELNLVEKRGAIGVVSNASTNQITITDIQGKSRQIDVDEITKFSSASTSNTFGLSDITKDTKISVLGLYNKQSKRILARFIRVSVDPTFLTGAILSTDSKNFTLQIISDDQKKTNIDVVTPTKISSHSKANPLLKIGFSKLSVGDRVSIIGFPDKKDTTLIVASRIIIFPELPKDPRISISLPTPTTAAAASTASSSAKPTAPAALQ